MKKYLALIMAFVFAFGCVNTVFAEEQYVSEGMASSTVTYHAESSYMVIIPYTIDANNTMMLRAANVNIGSNEIVRVKVTNLNENNYLALDYEYGGERNFTLHRSDDDQTIGNNEDVATFIQGCNEPSYGVNFRPVDMEMPAGNYSGTIQFSISLMNMN